MFCERCGSPLNETDKFCNACGASISNENQGGYDNPAEYQTSNYDVSQGQYEQDYQSQQYNPNQRVYQEQQSSNQTYQSYNNQGVLDIKTTAVLVFSILELICCNPITGIIALVLYFTNLIPTINSGDREKALKSKKTIKKVLWIGAILSLVIIIIYVAFSVITTIMFTKQVMNSIDIKDINQDAVNDAINSLSEQINPNDYNYDYDYYN